MACGEAAARELPRSPLNLADTFFNAQVMRSSLPALVRGLGNTLILSAFSIVCGALFGLFVSLVRLYAPRPLRWLAIGYIDLFRAMPMLVILILIYYALPFLGVRFSSWTSAVLAFSLVMAAYSAEVFRAGIEGVPRGQFEASAALGLPFLKALRRIILPQAIRAIIPPMTGNCVSMFKDTSLASTVALPELLNEATNSQALYANPSPLIMAAIIYILFLWPMVRLVSILERRFMAERVR
jgi:polar amino acid transport system permease protein